MLQLDANDSVSISDYDFQRKKKWRIYLYDSVRYINHTSTIVAFDVAVLSYEYRVNRSGMIGIESSKSTFNVSMVNAAMTNFLQLMLRREDDGDSRRRSSLRIFGSSKKEVVANESKTRGGLDDLKTTRPTGETNESGTRTTTTSRNSKNLVKRLVAAFERKRSSDTEASPLTRRRDVEPIKAYDEQSFETTKSESNHGGKSRQRWSSLDGKESRQTDLAPRIVGAFLKKPIEIDETSIYWIPITGKQLPRKKSFRRLLARLTGRGSDSSERPEFAKKRVVFASQLNLVEEIQDSGYEERSDSSRSSSVTSFTETLACPDAALYRIGLGTFVTSSPVRPATPFDVPAKIERIPQVTDLDESFDEEVEVLGYDDETDFEKETKIIDEAYGYSVITKKPNDVRISSVRSPRFFVVDDHRDHEMTKEDSGYASNCSSSRTTEGGSLVARRVEQITRQLSKVPRHPLAKSEPRLWRPSDNSRHAPEEMVTIRRPDRRTGNGEPVYDVPKTRPRSSIFDESLSLRRRNLPLPIFDTGLFGMRIDEQPHYATVKPRNGTRTLASQRVVRPSFYESPKKNIRNSNQLDVTANESFVVTMYV